MEVYLPNILYIFCHFFINTHTVISSNFDSQSSNSVVCDVPAMFSVKVHCNLAITYWTKKMISIHSSFVKVITKDYLKNYMQKLNINHFGRHSAKSVHFPNNFPRRLGHPEYWEINSQRLTLKSFISLFSSHMPPPNQPSPDLHTACPSNRQKKSFFFLHHTHIHWSGYESAFKSWTKIVLCEV